MPLTFDPLIRGPSELLFERGLLSATGRRKRVSGRCGGAAPREGRVRCPPPPPPAAHPSPLAGKEPGRSQRRALVPPQGRVPQPPGAGPPSPFGAAPLPAASAPGLSGAVGVGGGSGLSCPREPPSP